MCGPGAVKCSAVRPGPTIRRTTVVRVRKWTGGRARRLIRAVVVQNRAWAVLLGAQAPSAAAVVATKAAAGDAKAVVATNDD